MWVGGIYGRKDRKYGNYMAQLTSPYHVGVTTPADKVPPAKLYPNPAMEYIRFEFTVHTTQLFSFYIYDLQGQAGGVSDRQPVRGAGQNTISFNIAPLAPGNYVLKATGTNGEEIPAKVFE